MNKTTFRRPLSALAAAAMSAVGEDVRSKTRDVGGVAYTYRCPAGFAGDINRAHPFSVEPCLIDTANPPLAYGCAVLVNRTTNSVRQVAPGDTGVTRIYGVVSRDYPTQQMTGGPAAPEGAIQPPTSGAASVMRWGYIMVKVVGTPTKDGLAYVWVAANSGSHVQGGFEAAASAGNTAALVNAVFNGPPDANGIAELIIGVAQAA